MSKINFVTGNKHKLEELQSVLPDILQVDIDLSEVQAVDSREVIGAKLAEARKRMPQSAIIVEDTALHLACLNGFPGALVKWLLSCVGCQGICDLCQRMGNSDAEARTVIGYLPENAETPLFFEASLQGSISVPRGSRGFGWDPIFVPKGMCKTLAELGVSELQTIKMRRKAAEKLAQFLTMA